MTSPDRTSQTVEERLASIEQTVDLILETLGGSLSKDLLAFLQTDRVLGLVYLLVEATRTETDIRASLQHMGVHVSLATICRKARRLTEKRLIHPVKGKGKGKHFAKDPKIEHIFRLSPKLEALLALDR